MTVPLIALEAAVEGLTAINCVLLNALGESAPRLYTSGVRYRQPGKTEWHTVADLYDLLTGDCKDLVAARCAELRVFESEPATPCVYLTSREGRYHAVVRRADGTIEDPSLVLVEAERNER
jgi:hypothetical protein